MTFASVPVEVLTVDAGSDLLRALQSMRSAEMVRLRSVQGADAARTALAEHPPGLVLVDAGAAGSLATMERLHADGALLKTRTILCGPLANASAVEKGRAAGALDFMLPPYEPALLSAKLQLHVGSMRTAASLEDERRARLAAEQESRAAQRARSDLLASMGYEIRTPMTAILGMSHLALQSGLNPKQRNYVEKVERSAELLLSTLNDILDSSRIEAGTLELQRAPFELADLLESVGRLVAMRAEEKGLELLFDVPRELPRALVGDRSRLIQILVNLGIDAVRASLHGEIVIGVEALERNETRATLRFAVRHSVSVHGDAAGASTDFGATLSRQLLRLMGSEMVVSAPNDQARSVQFAVEFELAATQPAPDAPVAPDGARTLVVDDNATARRVMLAMAAELGLQAESARDGWDALRMASQAQRAGQPYELILLDWKMPGMDGAECAHHLLAAQSRPPAILMLTAYGQHDATQRLAAQRVAVRGVLSKPVTPAALGAAISAALRRGPAIERGADRAQALRDNAERLRGARILLVEDNPIIQELALELLSSAGMIVSLAENGREALDRLGKQSFDGVLMDVQMPVLDGYETTRALRAMPQLKDLPVIALTANALEGERERVIAAGMNDHIAKPLDMGLMFDTLARWVRPARPLEAPAPTAPEGSDDPLSRLPGISAEVGRSSTMNNDKLYRRLLGMFRDGQRDVVAQFKAARQAGDDATAMRLAHNLRAVSASLGALSVQQSASALERACADKSPDSTVEPLLAQVEIDLEPVMTGLTLLLPPA